MPKPTLHLDFETFSELSIKKHGTCRYAEHPSTEVLCAGWACDDFADGEVQLWRPGHLPPKVLFDYLSDGCPVHAWNVEMEIPIWEEVCVKRMGWPSVPRPQWRDTAAPALMLAFPAALEDAGHALGLKVVKDRRGKYLINKLCKPRKPSKSNPATRWTPETAPEDFEDFYEYCRQDVRAEMAIHRALPLKRLPPEEHAIWRLTTEMNLRGWSIDDDSARRMIQVLEAHKSRAEGEIEDLTMGLVQTAGQVDKIKRWVSAHGLFLDDLQKATVESALGKDDLHPKVRRLLELRLELAKISTKKYVSMLERQCDDGTVKNNILYHGASTGRDAGRGMQIQNFPRSSVSDTDEGVETALRVLRHDDPLAIIELMYGPVPQFASSMLRPMLVSSPGTDLVCADFSSIENRVVIWYAESPYGLKIFRDGLDEYKVFGTHFYHRPYDEIVGELRQHCKNAVLGFVFGMAEDTFIRQAASFGKIVSKKEGLRTKILYRKLYKHVVWLWYGLAEAAIECVSTGEATQYKQVRFRMRDDFLFMKLASGRNLAYYKPRVDAVKTPWGALKPTVTHMGREAKTGRWVRLKITPGRFTENAVQATARDIMMHGAVKTSERGYRLVGRVHDELVSEAREGRGSLDEYCRLMTEIPDWLREPMIPITATGWRGKRYKKD